MPRKRQTFKHASQTDALFTDDARPEARFHRAEHGLRGANVLLSWENQAEFEDFQSMIIQDLDPWGPLEYKLASRVADCLWRLDRLADYATWLAEVSSYRDEMMADLLNLGQYEAHIEQSLQRALQALRQLRADRDGGPRQPMPDRYFLVLENPAKDSAETDLSGPCYRPMPRSDTLHRPRTGGPYFRSLPAQPEDPPAAGEEPMYELSPAKLAELQDIVLELQALPDRIDQLPAFQRTHPL